MYWCGCIREYSDWQSGIFWWLWNKHISHKRTRECMAPGTQEEIKNSKWSVDQWWRPNTPVNQIRYIIVEQMFTRAPRYQLLGAQLQFERKCLVMNETMISIYWIYLGNETKIISYFIEVLVLVHAWHFHRTQCFQAHTACSRLPFRSV